VAGSLQLAIYALACRHLFGACRRRSRSTSWSPGSRSRSTIDDSTSTAARQASSTRPRPSAPSATSRPPTACATGATSGRCARRGRATGDALLGPAVEELRRCAGRSPATSATCASSRPGWRGSREELAARPDGRGPRPTGHRATAAGAATLRRGRCPAGGRRGTPRAAPGEVAYAHVGERVSDDTTPSPHRSTPSGTSSPTSTTYPQWAEGVLETEVLDQRRGLPAPAGSGSTRRSPRSPT
jgi:hypothetical protein